MSLLDIEVPVDPVGAAVNDADFYFSFRINSFLKRGKRRHREPRAVALNRVGLREHQELPPRSLLFQDLFHFRREGPC